MIVKIISNNVIIYIRVIEVGDKMNDRFYIYKCFFQEEPYFHLTMTQKFFLSLLYSLSDEEDIYRCNKNN